MLFLIILIIFNSFSHKYLTEPMRKSQTLLPAKFDFKIQPPDNKCQQRQPQYYHYKHYIETDLSQSTQTCRNPFIRTQSLFKAGTSGRHSLTKIQQPHQQKIQHRLLEEDSLPQEIVMFDSFGKIQGLGCSTVQHIKYPTISFQSLRNFESKQNKQIKICDQYSIINDDYEKPPTQARINKCVTQPNQSPGLFFLTQNQSKSSIKEFYLNLNDSDDANFLKQIEPTSSKKSQIKTLVYKFLDSLDTIPENHFSQQYISDLKNIFQQYNNELKCQNFKLRIKQNSIAKSDRKSINKQNIQSYSKSPCPKSSMKQLSKNNSTVKKRIWRCPGKVKNVYKPNQNIPLKTTRK